MTTLIITINRWQGTNIKIATAKTIILIITLKIMALIPITMLWTKAIAQKLIEKDQ